MARSTGDDNDRSNHDEAVEQEPGLVRPYIITSGRTRPEGVDLNVETIVKKASNPPPVSMGPEHRSIMLASEDPISIAEIASQIRLPLGVVTVLVSDLLSAHQLGAGETTPYADDSFVQKLIEGVRAL